MTPSATGFMWIGVSKNGVAPVTRQGPMSHSAGQVYNYSPSFVFSLATNDKVCVMVESTVACNISAYELALNVTSLN